MKFLLILLILSLSLTVNAQPGGSGAASLYGCFHNGIIYSTTVLNNLCSSLPPHTHEKQSHTFHYDSTGTMTIFPSQSKTLTPVSVTPLITQDVRVGDPECIIKKTPISQ